MHKLVQGEMRQGLGYFHETICPALPVFYRRIDTALKQVTSLSPARESDGYRVHQQLCAPKLLVRCGQHCKSIRRVHILRWINLGITLNNSEASTSVAPC